MVEKDRCEFTLETSNTENAQVDLIGLFDNLKSNNEHNYGYVLSIWKIDKNILGFINVYEGGIEPDRNGPIQYGYIDNDNLSLNIWTKKNKAFSNWKQSEVHIYSFTGKITLNKIEGNFIIKNCSNNELQPINTEEITLYKSNLWDLKSFNNFNQWAKYYSYELEY